MTPQELNELSDTLKKTIATLVDCISKIYVERPTQSIRPMTEEEIRKYR